MVEHVAAAGEGEPGGPGRRRGGAGGGRPQGAGPHQGGEQQ
jgi:hypothetical protein